MKGDFSRHTFDPARHYSGVRMQQGRVQLDADWNEQVDLARHRVETETIDTVGHCGGPLHDAGFRVIPLMTAPAGVKAAITAAYPGVNANTTNELVILPGRYYVDGVLVVCERPVLFGRQPDLPRVPVPATHGLQPGNYMVYLDVWERHVTALDDPLLREVALGGPDTTTRTRTIWQVGAWPLGQQPAGCPEPAEWVAKTTPPLRRLRARGRPAGPDQGPCVVPAGADYRGLENQLYRVEVHAPGVADVPPANPATAGVGVTADPGDARIVVAGSGTWNVGDTVLLYPTAANPRLRPTLAQVSARSGPNNRTLTLTARFAMDATDGARIRKIAGATYKWSRDNGIAVTRVTGLDNGDLSRIVVESLGPDEVLGFRSGDWVEISADQVELAGEPGLLAQVERVEQSARVVVLRAPFPGLAAADLQPLINPRLRRWDGLGIVGPGTELQGYQELEDGVQVRWEDGPFNTGDHWLIPARTATASDQGGTVEWPKENADHGVARPPLGIHHHFCRLATINVTQTSTTVLSDCRCLFAPLSELRPLAYVSGAGQEAMPDHSIPGHKPELGLPLVVGVGNGHCGVDARVRFKIGLGSGDVTATPGSYPGAGQTEVEVPVAADGTARCWWRLGGAVQHQTVTATLLELVDPAANVWLPVHGAVVFNASLSVASQVAYLPAPGCPPMAGQDTVQSAIDRLRDLVRIYPNGGDGQEARPQQRLECPLKVLVASTCGPVAGRPVEFKIGEGGGTLKAVNAPSGTAGATTVTVQTDAQGVAQVNWWVGLKGCQSVTASLLAVVGGIPLAEPSRAVFNATVSLAAEVEYTPASTCAMPTTGPDAVNTVEEALHWLCKNRGGGGCEVTVGTGGDYPTLRAALALLEQHPGVCICLLHGQHVVDETLVVSRDNGTVKITACGPGTRILMKKRIEVRGLESFILRDVDVLVADDGQITPAAILFSQCEQIVIENCRIGQGGRATTLVQVEKAARVRIVGCTMWSVYSTPADASEGADATGLDTPNALVEKVAGPSPAFVKEEQGGVGTLWGDMAVNFRVEYAVRNRGRNAAAAAPAPVVWQGADVVRLVDAQANVTLQDNVMIGYLRLYGSSGTVVNAAGFAYLMSLVSIENAVVAPGGGDLHVRGCSLLGIRVDAGFQSMIKPASGNKKHMTVEGVFRLCALTDTLFAMPWSTVAATQLRVTSNHFEMGLELAEAEESPTVSVGEMRIPAPWALLGLARSATATGNIAGDFEDEILILLSVSNGRGNEAGNYPAVQIF
ncbi:MAG TPA: DUF6519 domain-containing protein [Longimicrobium sp.]|nr:DUF6519 domain-containing protein [Longimicrobium sp.]